MSDAAPDADLPRHFTVTGFVSIDGRTALHWHPRLDRWLPTISTAPTAMAVYDIPRDGSLDGPHQHIDFIYFTRPLAAAPALPADADHWVWVDEATLRRRPAILEDGGRRAEVAEDVCELALAAIAAVRDHAETSGADPSGGEGSGR